MKIRWNHRYVQLGVTAFLVIAASILFYYGIFHMKSLVTGIKTFFSIMAPIIYGAAIAYLLTPIVNFLERKIIFPIFEKRHKTLQKKGRKVVRWICVILSVFFMFLIIYALVMMILPQLIRSIMNIIYSFPHYVNVVENWLNSVVEKGWKLNPDMISQINQYSSRLQEYLTNTILPQMQSMMKNISASFLDLLVFLRISLLERLYHFISWQIKRDLLQRPKWLPMRFFRPNGRLFLFIPCVLRIRLLADLSVARSWILQLSVYCVMWEHPSLERHMRFWSV